MARMKHIPFPSQLDYFEEGTEKIIFFREKWYWPKTKMFFPSLSCFSILLLYVKMQPNRSMFILSSCWRNTNDKKCRIRVVFIQKVKVSINDICFELHFVRL
jgi:hypothetical protein